MHRCYPIVALLMVMALPLPVGAQSYPTRPIKAIASQGAGGLSDLFMRALGEQLGPALGAAIVVEDRPGAEGTIGAKACADAAPDGYTICIVPSEALTINPVIYPSEFDPWKALAPVARPYYLTQVLAVDASLDVRTLPELAALVKSRPKTFSYMAPALSKVAFMEQFNKQNGTDIVRVPFMGGGDALTSMLNGTTQIAIFGIGNVVSFIRDGRVVGLAIDGDTRSPLAPDIPTFKEVGYTEHIAATFFGIFVPAGTPQPIINKLNQAIVAAESKPDFQQKFMISRGLTPSLQSTEQFATALPADRAEGLAVVKASGLYPDVK